MKIPGARRFLCDISDPAFPTVRECSADDPDGMVFRVAVKKAREVVKSRLEYWREQDRQLKELTPNDVPPLGKPLSEIL